MFKTIACSSIVDPWASVSYFQKGAPEQVDAHEGTWEGFWSMITGGDHQRRNTIRNPIIQVCRFCASGFLGRMRETKITNMELNWLYSALPGSQSTPLTYDQPVVLLSNIEFGRYWFGVLPLHVCYLFKTGYYKELEASPNRNFPRI
jgi:hypothetical protein